MGGGWKDRRSEQIRGKGEEINVKANWEVEAISISFRPCKGRQ